MKKLYFILAFCLLSTAGAFAQVIDKITGLDRPTYMAAHGTDLYFAQENSDYIWKADLTQINPTPTQVVQLGVVGTARGLTVEGDYLYYCENATPGLRRIDLTVASPTAEMVFATGVDAMTDILIEGDMVYFSTTNSIESVDLTDPSYTRTVLVANTGGGSYGFSKISDFLFYSTSGSTEIKRVNVFSSTVTVGVTGLNSVNGTDWINGNFYFTEGTDGKIMLMPSTIVVPATLADADTLATAGSELVDLLHIGDNVYASVINENKIIKVGLFLTSTEDITKANWKIYPNPTQDFIQFDGLETTENFTIIDVAGKMVQQGQVRPNDMISVQSLPSGMYFISLDNGDVQQFIKQ